MRRIQETIEYYQSIPKAELHVHLDGSIRPSTLFELGNALPEEEAFSYDSVEQLLQGVCFTPNSSLEQCLAAFDTTLKVLQDEESITRVTYELCEDLHKDGVTYAEIRYCPALHTNKGLSNEDVLFAVAKGLEGGRKAFGMETNQILCALRNFGGTVESAKEHTKEMFQLAHELRFHSPLHIVGVDIAGAEGPFPIDLFEEECEAVYDSGIPGTYHAGEGKGEAYTTNVINALELCGARRVSHAVALRDSLPHITFHNKRREVRMRSVRYMQKELQPMYLEVCPTSNIHTGSIDNYGDHPAPLFVDYGAHIIPCADNTLLSQTTTSTEYAMLELHTSLDRETLTQIAADSFQAKFSS